MKQLAPLSLVFLLLAATGCKKTEASELPAATQGEAVLSQEQLSKGNFKIEPIKERELGAQVITTGRMTFDDALVAHLFSPVTGRVTKFMAGLGQRVKKGDALVAIDSPDSAVAASDMDKARADLIASEHDLKRKKDLYALNAQPLADVEASEDNYRKSQAEMERASQKSRLLRTGSIQGGQFVLRAPIDGEVIARNVSPSLDVQGQFSGGAAQELYTIGEIDPLWMLADVYEVDLARIKQDAEVTIKVVTYPDQVFHGKVDWVSGSLDPNTRTVKVRCVVQNDKHLLKPEMYAQVSIAAPGHQALAVPRTAVVHMGETTVVFIQSGAGPAGGTKFERRPVVVDEEEPGDFIPITSGLKAGEQVVTSGALLMSGML